MSITQPRSRFELFADSREMDLLFLILATVVGFGVLFANVDVLLGPSQFPRRDHRVVATVDSNNAIAEENENDNSRTFTYRMRGGDCP